MGGAQSRLNDDDIYKVSFIEGEYEIYLYMDEHFMYLGDKQLSKDSKEITIDTDSSISTITTDQFEEILKSRF